jgi:SOS response regulatory protein OraA/RecX
LNDFESVRKKALNCLARREYSEVSLRARLLQSGALDVVVDQVISALSTEHLLDDRRFAQATIDQAKQSGYGFFWLQNRWQKEGLSEVLQAEFADSIDWQQHALDTLTRWQSRTVRSTIQWQRRLLQKGHSVDVVVAALRHTDKEFDASEVFDG